MTTSDVASAAAPSTIRRSRSRTRRTGLTQLSPRRRRRRHRRQPNRTRARHINCGRRAGFGRNRVDVARLARERSGPYWLLSRRDFDLDLDRGGRAFCSCNGLSMGLIGYYWPKSVPLPKSNPCPPMGRRSHRRNNKPNKDDRLKRGSHHGVRIFRYNKDLGVANPLRVAFEPQRLFGRSGKLAARLHGARMPTGGRAKARGAP
jgi:hypothetical protein